MQRAGRGLFQPGQTRTHIGVQHRRIGEAVEHEAAGELLGDRAHAKQRARREGDAPFGIGPAPGVADQQLAVPQHGHRSARTGIGAREILQHTVKARR